MVSRVICHDFYVDDLLTGCDDLNQLQSLKQDIIKILDSAGFQLAKWNSNKPSLLSLIEEEARAHQHRRRSENFWTYMELREGHLPVLCHIKGHRY